MTNKITASFKLPYSLQKELLQQVIADGYGMRGKSKWIIEAIISFLRLPNFPELVEIAAAAEELHEMTSVRIPLELMLKIEDATLEVRKNFPMLEGVKSNIIRASICQRLIRGSVIVGD